MIDDHKNFAGSLVATAPSPASSGTSLVVTATEGALFPTPPFNATVWPVNSQPTAGNAEIVRVTGVSTDTFTIARTQEGSSARTIVVGDQICATITDKTLTDVEMCARVFKFSFAFNTANLSNGTGATVYTPAVDDVLIDAWFSVLTAWDGTTPKGDIGTGVGNNFGLFATANGSPVDMNAADQDGSVVGGGAGILIGGVATVSIVEVVGESAGSAFRASPATFTATNPLKIWVTQDGALNGSDPGASQGAAIFYLVIATPAAL